MILFLLFIARVLVILFICRIEVEVFSVKKISFIKVSQVVTAAEADSDDGDN